MLPKDVARGQTSCFFPNHKKLRIIFVQNDDKSCNSGLLNLNERKNLNKIYIKSVLIYPTNTFFGATSNNLFRYRKWASTKWSKVLYKSGVRGSVNAWTPLGSQNKFTRREHVNIDFTPGRSPPSLQWRTSTSRRVARKTYKEANPAC